MNLTAPERSALTRLRLANAAQALADAVALRQANSVRGATNRVVSQPDLRTCRSRARQ